MIDDIKGGPPRRKPKIIQPLDGPKQPSIHEVAAREGHDLNASDAAGPEADAALGFTSDHTGEASAEQPSQTPVSLPEEDKKKPGDKQSRSKFAWLKRELSKKQKIIALVVAVLVVIGAGFAVSALKGSGSIQPLRVNAVPAPKPKPIYSPLTGMPVTEKQSKMPVTGVMIENSVPARPQSGLSQAGIVYEAIAEAGITRFLALYQYENPKSIGPVRSARPYFVRWDLGYHASYAHVGGSPEALQDIKNWKVNDLDQFYAGDNYYHRVSSRPAPHNMYTSMSKLLSLEKARGYGYKSFTGFARKDDSPAKNPSATTINMDISNPSYAVKYTYSTKSDSYKRYLAGSPHIDAGNGEQITPKVVVALVIHYGHKSDGYHSYYNNLGSGTAYVFEDGRVTQGEWQKASLTSPLELVDGANQPIKLNRGQTWITALADSSELSYK